MKYNSNLHKYRSLELVEEFSTYIASDATDVSRTDLFDDINEIVSNLNDAYDRAIRDLNHIADVISRIKAEQTPKPDAPTGNSNVGGYILTMLIRDVDGLHTVTRNIRVDHYDDVLTYIRNNYGVGIIELTESQLADFDNFLETLKG